MRNFIITVDGRQYEVSVEEVGTGETSPVTAQNVAAPAHV